MMEEAIVYLVDDDPAVLRALEHLVRSAGLATAAYTSAARFLDEHNPARPGCLVLDLSMPGLGGLAVQAALHDAGSPRPIIFLTGRGDIPTTVQAMKAGATDFLTKPIDDERLLAAVASALEKDRTQSETGGLRRSAAEHLGRLTPREHEVMDLILAGRLNKQIADRLGTTERTVKFHRSHLMSKLGIHHVAELARLADLAGEVHL